MNRREGNSHSCWYFGEVAERIRDRRRVPNDPVNGQINQKGYNTRQQNHNLDEGEKKKSIVIDLKKYLKLSFVNQILRNKLE